MKASSARLAPGKCRPSDPRESKAASACPASPRSPPADGGYPLAGPSDLPDPATNAYRRDLADVALAGLVIASHYAEPMERRLSRPAVLLAEPADEALVVSRLETGAAMRILDVRGGWAWGYGPDGRVGYVRDAAIGA